MEKKDKIIKDYIDSLEGSPAQKSEEWYRLRYGNVGGSEVAIIIGKNPYENDYKLILKKIGHDDFVENFNCSFGNLFEELTRLFTELLFQNNVFEAGSIGTDIPGLRFSPDGIGTVFYNGKYRITLFEYKAPQKLLEGKIPEYYVPQVLTGLSVIPIVEMGIFISASYRVCAINQIGFNGQYNQEVHNYKPNYTDKNLIPLVCGNICFTIVEDYKTKLTGLSDDEIIILNQFIEDSELVDFGAKPIDFVLKLVDRKILIPTYNKMISHSSIKKLDILKKCRMYTDIHSPFLEQNVKSLLRLQLMNFAKKPNAIGFMNYKIMRADVLAQQPISQFRTELVHHVNRFMNILQQVKADKNPLACADRLCNKKYSKVKIYADNDSDTDE